jgi:hypothetical protein
MGNGLAVVKSTLWNLGATRDPTLKAAATITMAHSTGVSTLAVKIL